METLKMYRRPGERLRHAADPSADKTLCKHLPLIKLESAGKDPGPICTDCYAVVVRIVEEARERSA